MIQKRGFPLFILLLLIIVNISACQSNSLEIVDRKAGVPDYEPPASRIENCETDEVFCVGLVTDIGELDD